MAWTSSGTWTESTKYQYRPLRLSDFNQFNAATYLDVGGASDLGGSLGWSIPVLGGVGKSVTDPFSGWHAISKEPVRDIEGALLGAAKEWAMWLGLHEVSGGGTPSADIDCVIGLCNGPTDGASMDAIGCGFRQGAVRIGLTVQTTNGVATLTSGTSLTTIRRIRFPVIKAGNSASALVRPVMQYQDGSNATLNAANGAASAGTSYQAGGAFDSWANASPYLFVAAYRTSTTDATARTLVYQPLSAPPVALTTPA